MDQEAPRTPGPVAVVTQKAPALPAGASTSSELVPFDQNVPVHESVEGVEVLWQIPPNPRALLLIAHPGCGSPGDFWPRHPGCTGCKGLPEHSTLVKSAVSTGYAVLAIKSVKDYWQTWPLEVSQDAFNVEGISRLWRSRQELAMLPLVALGFASGASFLSSLALRVEFSALVLCVSHGVSRAFEKASNRYPPSLFIHMPKDSLTAAKIGREVRVLQGKGIPTDVITCLDFAISSTYFADNLPRRLSLQASSKLFAALAIHGVINREGFVTSALHHSEIKDLLCRADIFMDDEQSDQERDLLVESINNLIRVAEARHAVTARRCDELFEWLEQHIIRRHL